MGLPILNRRLVLEAPERVPDGAGGYTEVWTALGELWAEVRPGTGRESAGEFLTLSAVPYRIIVRAAPVGAVSRPKPEQRFREGGRVFLITAVTEHDPRGHYLVCFASEEATA
ncbi:MAG: head-tail adaptor protein [Paracoccaceae bacterium]|nr:head-tail adaptor protein [Paracoccaceae bacterium]